MFIPYFEGQQIYAKHKKGTLTIWPWIFNWGYVTVDGVDVYREGVYWLSLPLSISVNEDQRIEVFGNVLTTFREEDEK